MNFHRASHRENTSELNSRARGKILEAVAKVQISIFTNSQRPVRNCKGLSLSLRKNGLRECYEMGRLKDGGLATRDDGLREMFKKWDAKVMKAGVDGLRRNCFGLEVVGIHSRRL